MKILSIGNFGTSWDGSICDEKHIAEALKDLGHKVIEMQRESLHFSLSEEFDFILIAQWSGYPIQVCQKLKQSYHCPVIYWAFDYQFDSQEQWHFEMAKEADLFLSKELNNKEFYKSIGANFHWLSQDFAPEFLKKKAKFKKEYEVVFTGTYLPQAVFRNQLLKEIDKNFDLHIFTVTPDLYQKDGFKNVHPPILDEGLIDLYSRTKINLSCDWKQAEGYWSDRNAQIMACGGFVLNKYVSPQEIVFHDKIVYFNQIKECLEKIDYFLKNEKEREEIAFKGYKYAQKNLKVKNRVNQLLTIVENKLL